MNFSDLLPKKFIFGMVGILYGMGVLTGFGLGAWLA